MPKGLKGFQKGHQSFLTEKGREKLSDRMKGNTYGFQKGQIPWIKGKHPTAWNKGLTDTQEANSGSFQKGQKSWNKGIKKATNTGRTHFKRGDKRITGKNNPNWKGGTTTLQNKIRSCWKYKKWRKAVFERDNYTCKKCKQKGGKLNVDHYPKSFAEIIRKYKITTLKKALACKELWKLKKGRTLCFKCHKKTDNYLKNNKNL